MPDSALSGILADTWWYGLSKRCSIEEFTKLAQLRASQGFNTIQLVVGIPPETGPENRSNWSEAGPAWTISGEINEKYLSLAVRRVELLNSLGLKVIVYGAWGYQIEWLGSAKMTAWWLAIHSALHECDVEYCLTGELDLWLEQPDRLLPDKTTDDLQAGNKPKSWTRKKYWWYVGRHQKSMRRTRLWKQVIAGLPTEIKDRFIVHPTVKTSGKSLMGNSVAMETLMTGHDKNNRTALWQRPIKALEKFDAVINLEPWYEGINNSFGPDDQLFAYWCSMLSGCEGFCYGAQGIWNMGDGKFLSHWGTQTSTEAMQLNTPHLLGESHKVLRQQLGDEILNSATVKSTEDSLLSIRNRSESTAFEFIPDASNYSGTPTGLIWLPGKAVFNSNPPQNGPMVLINPADQAPE